MLRTRKGGFVLPTDLLDRKSVQNHSSLYPFIPRTKKHTCFKSGIPPNCKHVCIKNRAITPMPNNLQSIHGVMTTRLSHFHLDVASRTNGMCGGSGPYDRLYLYPSGKLAFCGIPKAGITQWLHFLRFTIGAKDYQSIPYCKATGCTTISV